jgi:hypothetical protein
MALSQPVIPPGLVTLRSRKQYASHDYTELLEPNQIRIGVSRSVKACSSNGETVS